MAAAGGGTPVKDLCEEATCPICLDYFEDPVIITGCGHNFCRACLTQSWENSVNKVASCPQCRKPSRQSCLLPNRQLAACVEIAKKLREGEKGKICEKHQAPLTLFCKDEEISLCAMCEKSNEHRNHELVPLEEAAHKYKDLIFSRLDILRKKREQILTQKADAEKESQDLFKSTETERQKMVAQFQEMHRFLEDQEKLFLDQIEEVEKEIAKKRDEHLARLSSKLTSLEGIIQEMEEQCHHQVASEFLQGVRSTLQRSEEREISEDDDPAAFSPELRWKIWDFCDVNYFLNGLMEPFKGNLLHGQQLRKADVSLDPETAHRQLILSGDRKSVKWGDEPQDLPNNPERFDLRAFVLGREGFTQGRHFWEVLVGSEGTWAVGVARKSVRRKAPLTISPKEGIWAVGMSNGKYWSQQSPDVPLQTLSRKLTKIQVILNYAGERVAFFDADTGSLLYTFLTASFSGETLLPFFYPKKSHLSISP